MWFVPEPEEAAAAAPAPPPQPSEPPAPPPSPPVSPPPEAAPPPPRAEPVLPAFDEAEEAEAPAPEPEPEPEPELTPPPLRARDDEPPRPRARATRAKGTTLPAVRRTPRRWPARLAWLALIALLVAIGAGASLYRDRIVAAWPAAERLYAAVGFEPAPLGHGLSLEILQSGQVEDGGTTVLQVSGRIENTTTTTREVPPLRAALFDAEERELQHWSFRAPVPKLLPKEQVTFKTRLKNPPKDAVRLSIIFHDAD